MFARTVLPTRQEHRPPGHQAGECRLRRQELRKLFVGHFRFLFLRKSDFFPLTTLEEICKKIYTSAIMIRVFNIKFSHDFCFKKKFILVFNSLHCRNSFRLKLVDFGLARRYSIQLANYYSSKIQIFALLSFVHFLQARQ
jgi:hypothetical protein